MNIKSLLVGSALAVGSLFGGLPPAEAGVACGSSSIAISHSSTDAYMMFHDGGNATFSGESGRKSYGTWVWSGNDIVSNVNGNITVWDDVRLQPCDFHY